MGTADSGKTWSPLPLEPAFIGPGVLSADGTQIHDLVRYTENLKPGRSLLPTPLVAANARPGAFEPEMIHSLIPLCEPRGICVRSRIRLQIYM